ncbi:MAG: histidine--tRNA ligase [Clostridia bacterium]|nr:histidine--tRNA ligase [Clostridia bacterium]
MINIPKGTKDVLPDESYKWHYVEDKIRRITRLYDVKEIRTPTFEHTELFLRGVGETTDVVNKEMYTFNDKGGRSITLKPEGTAGCARAFIENGLQQNLPVRIYYETPVFRYEKPQAGRLREHHQFGVEYYGVDSYTADVEVMSLAKDFFDSLGISPRLNINSIGCAKCRADYHKALKDFLADNVNNLCETCRERIKTNPLRVLDCKVPTCKELLKGAPSTLDYLCDDCRAHHEGVKKGLENLGIEYKVNPKIVRGLDYYTRTVFEFIAEGLGSQDTVCGGGRYNNLIESVGGKPTPGVGFGMGLERLLMTVEAAGNKIENEESPDIFICSVGQKDYCQKLVADLRKEGVAAVYDLSDRSIKAQMKYADKIKAKYSIAIGDNEIAEGVAVLKNMLNGETQEIILAALSQILKTIL